MKRRQRPDFYHLETFLKVVETRSFARAAAELGVTQPAVSQTIARLEDILGGDLFERSRGAPVALTPIGQAILPKAKLLLFTVDQQIERALSTAQSFTGTLTVGFYTGLACGPLNKGIAEFRESHADIDLRIVESSPFDLHRELNDRNLDIIFCAHLTDAAGNGIQQERLWDEPIVIALQESHPLSTRNDLRWDDLVSLPLMMRSHGGDLTAYRTIASRMGDRRFLCDLQDVSRGALIEMVRLGLGAAISFASAVVPRKGVIFKPIADVNGQVGIDALWSKDDRNPLRHRFLAIIRDKAAKRREMISSADGCEQAR